MKKCIKLNIRFERRIFLEGLYQLRYVTTAYLVIAAFIGILPFLLGVEIGSYSFNAKSLFIESFDRTETSVVPVLSAATAVTQTWLVFTCLVFTAAALVYLYSFRYNAKSRDFYCALPFSTGSLWFNFTLSAYSAAVAGILLAHLIHLPFVLILAPEYIVVWLSSIVSVVAIMTYFGSVIALVGIVTGKLLPFIAVSAGLLVLPDMVIQAYRTLYNAFCAYNLFYPKAYGDFGLFTPIVEYLSGCIISSYLDYRLINNFKHTALLFVFSAIYIAAGVYFAGKSTNNTSCKSFADKYVHYAALLIVNLSIAASLISRELNNAVQNPFEQSDWHGALLPSNWGNLFKIIARGNKAEYVTVVLIIVVLFWLSEVLFTLDLKKSHHILKLVPISFFAAFAIVFAGCFNVISDCRSVVDADKIASVSYEYQVDKVALSQTAACFNRVGTSSYLSFEKNIIVDKEIISAVALGYKKYIESDRPLNGPCVGSDYKDSNYYVVFKVNLKNGRTIRCPVILEPSYFEKIDNVFKTDTKFMEACLKLPEISKNLCIEINDMSASAVTYDNVFDDLLDRSFCGNESEIYASLKSEFESKSFDERLDLYINGFIGEYSNGYWDCETATIWEYYLEDEKRHYLFLGRYDGYSYNHEYYDYNERKTISQYYPAKTSLEKVVPTPMDVFFSLSGDNTLHANSVDIYCLDNTAAFYINLYGYKNNKTDLAFSEYLEVDKEHFPITYQMLLGSYIVDEESLANEDIDKFFPAFCDSNFFVDSDYAVYLDLTGRYGGQAFCVEMDLTNDYNEYISYKSLNESEAAGVYNGHAGAYNGHAGAYNGHDGVYSRLYECDLYPGECRYHDEHLNPRSITEYKPYYRVDCKKLLNKFFDDATKIKPVDFSKPYIRVEIYAYKGDFSGEFSLYIQGDIRDYIDFEAIEKSAEEYRFDVSYDVSPDELVYIIYAKG